MAASHQDAPTMMRTIAQIAERLGEERVSNAAQCFGRDVDVAIGILLGAIINDDMRKTQAIGVLIVVMVIVRSRSLGYLL